MRLYRVNIIGKDYEHQGYSYHSSFRSASIFRRQCHKHGIREGYLGKKWEYPAVEVYQFNKDRRGIIKLLEHWGSHPDNG